MGLRTLAALFVASVLAGCGGPDPSTGSDVAHATERGLLTIERIHTGTITHGNLHGAVRVRSGDELIYSAGGFLDGAYAWDAVDELRSEWLDPEEYRTVEHTEGWGLRIGRFAVEGSRPSEAEADAYRNELVQRVAAAEIEEADVTIYCDLPLTMPLHGYSGTLHVVDVWEGTYFLHTVDPIPLGDARAHAEQIVALGQGGGLRVVDDHVELIDSDGRVVMTSPPSGGVDFVLARVQQLFADMRCNE